MNINDAPKIYIELKQFCYKQSEKPFFCKLGEIKRYSFASLASLSTLSKNFFDELKIKDSIEIVLKDKDENIKEMREQ